MPLREDLLQPIPGSNPAGANLRYDPIYDKIKEARREEEDVDQGDWKRTRKVADWPLVIKLSGEALATKSKDLQIFGLRRQRFAGQFDDERPVSDLARALPVALVDVLLLAARLLDLVVDRIVAEVRPRRIRARDRLQQVFPQRHGGSAGRGGRQRDVELAQFENREWLVVHEEQLLAHRDRRAVL